ncbi:CYTH domain-containing protein [Myxococcota bacterium]|nr:CYTH domain-containing protein [Myxococcota bacterium]
MSSDPYEIELRFLVQTTAWPRTPNPPTITQGYLSMDPTKSVRVRIVHDESAFLTIKGPSEGAKRREFEYAIPIVEARSLLEMCEFHVVKLRHEITMGRWTWEVDEFLDQNAGLVIAEVELQQESEAKQVRNLLPEWTGPEVTGIHEYSNLSLSQHPYGEWTPEEREFRTALA